MYENIIYNVFTILRQYKCNTLYLQEMFGEDINAQHQIDQLLDVCERILPTLDANDRATVKESIESLNKRVVDVCANSQTTRKELANLANEWSNYQVTEKFSNNGAITR